MRNLQRRGHLAAAPKHNFSPSPSIHRTQARQAIQRQRVATIIQQGLQSQTWQSHPVGGFILTMRQICRSHDPESIMGARVCFCPMRLPSVLLRRTAARTRTSRRKVGRCAKAEVFALLPSEGQPSSLSS